MPANLTPEYEKAEARYRAAATDEERLEALQEMLRVIPKHKGTDRMQGDLKRRISQLRKSAAKGTKRKGPDPFHVPKSGAGQVVLIGGPNAGKSSLLAATTNAPVKVADYPYTTATPVPGMWERRDLPIQLVDTPPVIEGQLPAGLMGTINAADVIAVVVDAGAAPLEQMEAALGLLGERGLRLRSVPRNELDASDRHARSALVVAAKSDTAPAGEVEALRELAGDRLEIVAVSAETGDGLEELFEALWRLLAVVRVYTKEPGKPADRDRPFALLAGSTVEDLAREIHRDLPEIMKFVRVWGEGRFAGQQVHRDEPLRDGDVVEIHQ